MSGAFWVLDVISKYGIGFNHLIHNIQKTFKHTLKIMHQMQQDCWTIAGHYSLKVNPFQPSVAFHIETSHL